MNEKELKIKEIRKNFPYAKIIDYSQVNLNNEEIYVIKLDDLIKEKVEEINGIVLFYFDVLTIVGLYNKSSFFLKANYSIKKIENTFFIDIRLNADIDLDCDLCGNNFIYNFEFNTQEIHSKNYNLEIKEIQDAYYFDFNDDKIDIGRIILENFISNLPLKFTDNCK
ncbi:MAG: hypothetical protein ACP5RD_03880 [bacterium]|jgi:hypothetical protein